MAIANRLEEEDKEQYNRWCTEHECLGGASEARPGRLKAEEAKAKRCKRGRPPDTDPKADKRIWDAWQSGQYKTYGDLARELRISDRAAETGIDRHRKRLERGGG
jgi:hypothetical protein